MRHATLADTRRSLLSRDGAKLNLLSPINDWVFVKEEAKPQQIGSIFLTDKSQKRKKHEPFFAEVLATGTGTYNEETNQYIPTAVKPGDRVILTGFCLQEFDGMIIVKDSDIQGVVE